MMRHRLLIGIVLGSIAVLPIALVVAGQAAPAPPPSAGATNPAEGKDGKSKERKIKLESASMDYDNATETYVFAHATVELPDSNAVMRADRVEWNKSERWMRATGKPRLWDERNELTADTIHADLKVKRANADGSVRLVARPKEAKTESGRKAREQIKEPVVVRCDTMQYFYKDKRGTGTGNLRITQKDSKADRTATGERLSYDGNDEVILLEGDVHISTTRGEGFRCAQVTFSIKDGAEGFKVKGLTGGVFYVQDEEEEQGGKKAPEGGTEGKTPPAGGTAPPPPPAKRE